MITYYSNSSTSTFRRCTYKFDKLYLTGGDREDPKSRGLALGSAGHMALNAFYQGKNISECLEWALEEFAPTSEEESKDFERLTAVLKFYWNNVAPTDRWKVLEVERKLYWERFLKVDAVLYQNKNRRILEDSPVGGIQGILDLLVQDPAGRVFIVDHKFQQSRQVSHLETDSQVSFYLLLAKLHNIKVDGMLYNIIPMGYKSEPEYPIRRFVRRSDNFLRNFHWELEAQIALIEQFSRNPKPIRNFTKDCCWDCGVYKQCLQGMEKD